MFPSRAHPLKKILGNWEQQAGAVAAQAVGVYSAAVREARNRGERAVHHFARWWSAEPGNKPNSAGVMVHGRAPVWQVHLT